MLAAVNRTLEGVFIKNADLNKVEAKEYRCALWKVASYATLKKISNADFVLAFAHDGDDDHKLAGDAASNETLRKELLKLTPLVVQHTCAAEAALQQRLDAANADEDTTPSVKGTAPALRRLIAVKSSVWGEKGKPLPGVYGDRLRHVAKNLNVLVFSSAEERNGLPAFRKFVVDHFDTAIASMAKSLVDHGTWAENEALVASDQFMVGLSPALAALATIVWATQDVVQDNLEVSLPVAFALFGEKLSAIKAISTTVLATFRPGAKVQKMFEGTNIAVATEKKGDTPKEADAAKPFTEPKKFCKNHGWCNHTTQYCRQGREAPRKSIAPPHKKARTEVTAVPVEEA